MIKIIHTIPDRTTPLDAARSQFVTGRSWIRSIATTMKEGEQVAREAVLEMSTVTFVRLFEWTIATAHIERLLSTADHPVEVYIDLRGESAPDILRPQVFLDYEANVKRRSPSAPDRFNESRRIYSIAGYLTSVGTLDVLNTSARVDKRVAFRYMNATMAGLRSFYGSSGRDSILLGLSRIESKSDCQQFLDSQAIQKWKQVMGQRYAESPLLNNEAFWRVLCHETAVNMFEHAGCAGFIAARIIDKPTGADGELSGTWSSTYDLPPELPANHFRNGLLELCISDCGPGIAATLSESFHRRRPETAPPHSSADILAFAFDELGTCKTDANSWASERHALARVLGVVESYGGLLRIWSGDAELFYCTQGGWFARRPNRMGLEPTSRRQHDFELRGTHLQVLLPLFPDRDGAPTPSSGRRFIEVTLPEGVRVDRRHPTGHLVPVAARLRACGFDVSVVPIGEDVNSFKVACDRLCRELLEQRAPQEPLIFDFGEIDSWTDAQFETFLYLVDNCIRGRPVLLVDIATALAKLVSEGQYRNIASQLPESLRPTVVGAAGEVFDRLDESFFLGHLRRYLNPILGIDQDGGHHLFGVASQECADALLTLIDNSETAESLCRQTWGPAMLSKWLMEAILSPANALFRPVTHGLYTCTWSSEDIRIQRSRSLQLHFTDVAKRCRAWGDDDADSGAGDTLYYMPGHREWRKGFLQCSRILERTRYADEIAQRLIARLQAGLGDVGSSLEEVKVLAYATTPAGLLGVALQRWWPARLQQPYVADLGYYLMAFQPWSAPTLLKADGVVVVQDVVDKLKTTSTLLRLLQKDGVRVLGVLAFVEMRGGTKSTSSDGMNRERDAQMRPNRLWSLVNQESPASADPPLDDEARSRSMWVEPRSLRPFRYQQLRSGREMVPWQPGRLAPDSGWPKRHIVEQYLSYGHYVFGQRHYVLHVDIQGLAKGPAGLEVAEWIADVCAGKVDRNADWESSPGKALTGDVTCVLMPLHGHINSTWSIVERLLAQRGRRQLYWHLEATMFVGSGPAYFPPDQLDDLIRNAIELYKDSRRVNNPNRCSPVRILILDDSVCSGRTGETLLTTLISRIMERLQEAGVPASDAHYIVGWIRYFALLNQMGRSRDFLWHGMRDITELRIPFVMDEFAMMTGFPVFDSSTCPACGDFNRLDRLADRLGEHHWMTTGAWARRRADMLRPVAADAPRSTASSAITISMAPSDRPRDEVVGQSEEGIQYATADIAVWCFYQAMYNSYPITDVLESLHTAFGGGRGNADERDNLERYRAAVLTWCLHNWGRVRSNDAQRSFTACLSRELMEGTPLAKAMFEGSARHNRDKAISELIVKTAATLAELERAEHTEEGEDERRRTLIANHYDSLEAFCLSLPKWTSRSRTFELVGLDQATIPPTAIETEIDGMATIKPGAEVGASASNGVQTPIADRLWALVDTSVSRKPSLLANLLLQLSRPNRVASLHWTLSALAESMYRGRDPSDPIASPHRLLPFLLEDIVCRADPSRHDLLALESALRLFRSALDDLKAFFHSTSSISDRRFTLPFSAPVESVIDDALTCSDTCLRWVASTVPGPLNEIPRELNDLLLAIDTEGGLYKSVAYLVHQSLADIASWLKTQASEFKYGAVALDFRYLSHPAELLSRVHVLTYVPELLVSLSNLAIEPSQGRPTASRRSRVVVSCHRNAAGDPHVRFRLLTAFATFDEAQEAYSHRRSSHFGHRLLQAGGAVFGTALEKPTSQEVEDGFTTAFECSVLAGFLPRGI